MQHVNDRPDLRMEKCQQCPGQLGQRISLLDHIQHNGKDGSQKDQEKYFEIHGGLARHPPVRPARRVKMTRHPHGQPVPELPTTESHRQRSQPQQRNQRFVCISIHKSLSIVFRSSPILFPCSRPLKALPCLLEAECPLLPTSRSTAAHRPGLFRSASPQLPFPSRWRYLHRCARRNPSASPPANKSPHRCRLRGSNLKSGPARRPFRSRLDPCIPRPRSKPWSETGTQCSRLLAHPRRQAIIPVPPAIPNSASANIRCRQTMRETPLAWAR